MSASAILVMPRTWTSSGVWRFKSTPSRVLIVTTDPSTRSMVPRIGKGSGC